MFMGVLWMGAGCLNLIIGDSYSGCMYRKGRLKPAIIED